MIVYKIGSLIIGVALLLISSGLYLFATRITNSAVLVSFYLKYIAELSFTAGFFLGISFILFLKDNK